MAEQLKVVIENFPQTHWYQEWVPISIAIISLVVSVISLWWNRRDYIRSSRPFVWASSYGYIDSSSRLIPVPQKIGYRIINSPAKIIESIITISFNDKILFNHLEKELIRFPDSSSEWSFGIADSEFKGLLQKSRGNENNLTRILSIKYSSLDGGKVYEYKLRQSYSLEANQWKDITVESK